MAKFAEIRRWVWKGKDKERGFTRDKFYNELEIGRLDRTSDNFFPIKSIYLKIVKKKKKS